MNAHVYRPMYFSASNLPAFPTPGLSEKQYDDIHRVQTHIGVEKQGVVVESVCV